MRIKLKLKTRLWSSEALGTAQLLGIQQQSSRVLSVGKFCQYSDRFDVGRHRE